MDTPRSDTAWMLLGAPQGRAVQSTVILQKVAFLRVTRGYDAQCVCLNTAGLCWEVDELTRVWRQ